ncbi:NACHT domain-containing protein [Lentzea aerocolonigenes]|uniref:NACHT domain-containing protein n=1 Tax=Lentzea aerocolonigenes TaxID=68170 RepID=UPI0012DC179F|nr:NACHT domain-containing protein [Lentzea aerocolonigenes]
MADRLRETVTTQWRFEEERRRLHDPFPLTLRWKNACESLIDHWSNIRRLPSGKAGGALNLAGELGKISEIYRRVPSGRLVVLGAAGSGKSVLLLNLVLDLLTCRRVTEPVPVMFNLISWNPGTTSFRGWLVDQLVRDHPWLCKTGIRTENLAAELVDRRKILPVLDGFDEMAAGLHAAALEALNRNQMPLVLASRRDEFAATVRSADVLSAAAAIEMSELKPSDVAAYLPRTAAQRSAPAGGSDWDAVLTELREHPTDEAAENLAAVLSTPLMVGLARTIYSDAPDKNPKELLDTDVFRSPEAVRTHLLDAFLPAAFRQPPRRRSAGARIAGRYTADDAKRWLTHLAGSRHQEIAWWRLSNGVAPVTATVLYVAIFAAVFGCLFSFEAALVLTAACTARFVYIAARSLPPAQAYFQVRDLAVALKQEALRGVRGKFVEGLLFGGVVGAGLGLIAALKSLAAGAAIGLASCLTGTLIYVVAVLRPRILSRSVNTRSAPCPIEMIADDRKCALVRSVVCGLAASVPTLGLFDVRRAAEMAFAVTILFALSETAWGRWVVIVRFWLPLTRRLPWRLNAFLDEACDRAVLRQSGAVYEFRHLALRDNLTTDSSRRGLIADEPAPLRRCPEPPPPAGRAS